MKNENTGLALSEVKGLLANLNDNLSGEHGAYWLTALKKLLRKEEIPEPPPEVMQEISKLNPHREKMKEKVKEIANHFERIPVVSSVHVIGKYDDDNDLININVYASVATFFHQMEDCDTLSFYLRTDGLIHTGNDHLRGAREIDIDSIYKEWFKKLEAEDTMKLKDLYSALIELGKIYEKSILEIKFQ